MRKPRKEKQRTQQDLDFERLYRTIPAGRSTTETFNSQLPEEPGKATSRRKRVTKRVIIILAILLVSTGIFLSWKFAANIIKIFGWSGLKDVFSSQKLDGENQGRVNVLLAGNSSDDAGHGGADLTDSIMLVSIDTRYKRGFILSIPRDLYVDIPSFGYAKINETYQKGKRANFKENDYPEGGMGLLQKVINDRFGVKSQYYALVNYTALQQAVDAVGGIDITIESSDPRGLYDATPDLKNNRQPLVKLPNGPVTLDGRTALNLARARGNGRVTYGYAQSDFTRTEYQRKILVGLKQKATSAGTLANPLKVGSLLDSLGSNVTTDFEAGEVRRLQEITKDIPDSQILSVSLNNADGKNLLKSYTTKARQSALIPALGIDDYSAIHAFIAQLMAPPPETTANSNSTNAGE